MYNWPAWTQRGHWGCLWMEKSMWAVGLGHKYLFILPSKRIWNIPGRAFRLYPNECVPSRGWVILIIHRCCLFVENHFLDFRTIKGILRKKSFSSVVQPTLGNKTLGSFHKPWSQQVAIGSTLSLKWLEPCRIALIVGLRGYRKGHLWKLLGSHESCRTFKRTSSDWWVRSSAAACVAHSSVAGYMKNTFRLTSCLQEGPQVWEGA